MVLFFVIPGMIVFTLFAITGPVINIEHVGAITGMQRSAELVRHHFWLVLVFVAASRSSSSTRPSMGHEWVVDHALSQVFLVAGHHRDDRRLVRRARRGQRRVRPGLARSDPEGRRGPAEHRVGSRHDLVARDRRRARLRSTSASGLRPAAYDRFRELYGGLWDPTVIDPRILELCRLRIATILGCDAERAIRFGDGVEAGVTEADVAELPRWPTSPSFTATERACIGFAEQYVMDPARAHRRPLRRAARAPRRTRRSRP